MVAYKRDGIGRLYGSDDVDLRRAEVMKKTCYRYMSQYYVMALEQKKALVTIWNIL